VVEYRGTTLEEMDLGAVLRRQPQVALVDELAHTNVPGSGRNGKRWQDVLDVGARWHEIADDDPARAIARFAREHQITQIVIGSSRRSRWQQLTGGGSNVTRVIREADPLGIDVHVIALRRSQPLR
jgi:K+-sensing histidine kinase KdpD